MPPFAGKIPEDELKGMIDYLMSLKEGKQEDTATEEHGTPEPAEAATPVASEHGEKTKKLEPETEPAEPADLARQGENLANKNGCLGCHSTDGSRRVGPSFKGLMGSERTVVKDGKEIKVMADSDYLRRSIHDPSSEVVQGYPAAMPPFPGLSDQDIEALRAWLETLK